MIACRVKSDEGVLASSQGDFWNKLNGDKLAFLLVLLKTLQTKMDVWFSKMTFKLPQKGLGGREMTLAFKMYLYLIVSVYSGKSAWVWLLCWVRKIEVGQTGLVGLCWVR